MGCLHREGEKGQSDGDRYVKRRWLLILLQTFLAPLVVVVGLWATNWIDIVLFSREAPKQISANATLVHGMEKRLDSMSTDIAEIRVDLRSIVDEHKRIRQEEQEIKAEQKALWHREYGSEKH